MRFFKELTKDRIKHLIKKILQLIFNPKLLLCLFIGWMITNGWSYLMLGLGIFFKVTWMQAVAATYLSLLWIPFTPEKIITVAIAIFLLKFLFPKDEKTLGVLTEMFHSVKKSHVEGVERRRKKRAERRARRKQKNQSNQA